jgi:hypothetical protein
MIGMKGQSLVIQFVLFFIIGFTIFLSISNFFKIQSEALSSDALSYGLELTNSYLSSSTLNLITTCKTCTISNATINLANTTAGYYITARLGQSGLDTLTPYASKKIYTSTMHNINESVIVAAGGASSAKPISLTYSRTKNQLEIA